MEEKTKTHTEMKPRKHWVIALFTTILIAVFLIGLASYLSNGSYKAQSADTSSQPVSTPTLSAGYCSTHSECRNFGTRNCGGYQFGLCGEDNLCHCCIPLNNQRCISCQEINCPSTDRYCLGGSTGACAFKIGGKTTQ